MATLESIRQIYVAQPFDGVRFSIAIRNYLADATRRRRDQLITWSRKDTPVAQAEPADARRLCMRLFKPDLDRAFLTAFVPLELGNAGVADAAHELALVQAELTAARQALTTSDHRAHRLELALAEARRQADLLARQLREQDGGELKLRDVISELEDDLIDCRDKLDKRGRELREIGAELGRARQQVRSHEEKIAGMNVENGYLREQAQIMTRARDVALTERAGLLDQLAAVKPQLDRLAEIDKNNSTHYESEIRLLELD